MHSSLKTPLSLKRQQSPVITKVTSASRRRTSMTVNFAASRLRTWSTASSLFFIASLKFTVCVDSSVMTWMAFFSIQREAFEGQRNRREAIIYAGHITAAVCSWSLCILTRRSARDQRVTSRHRSTILSLQHLEHLSRQGGRDIER